MDQTAKFCLYMPPLSSIRSYKEMVDYAKSNVLMQAAQSMLVQANQSSSGVLSLLQ